MGFKLRFRVSSSLILRTLRLMEENREVFLHYFFRNCLIFLLHGILYQRDEYHRRKCCSQHKGFNDDYCPVHITKYMELNGSARVVCILRNRQGRVRGQLLRYGYA